MFDLQAIQNALREFGLDGWLLCDFRGSNVLARRILDMDGRGVGSRRFFYGVPAAGEPRKLAHRIEAGALDHLPGEKMVYLRWQELEAGVAQLVNGMKRVAMEYSPRNANPYVARVDAGTVELVRGCGVEVVSSGDLIQLFEATWDDAQWAMHLEAAQRTDAAFSVAWAFIAQQIRERGSTTETAVQQVIADYLTSQGLTFDHPAIVAVNANSGNPHYAPPPDGGASMREGDFVLIDLWAKLNQPRAVMSDLTRVGFIGSDVPQKYEDIFQIVARARDAAIDFVRDAFARGRVLCGWEVDAAARRVIEQAGYGEYFIHRTGHSLGQETHGNGANMDNLETHDERRVLCRTAFTIEPGIYLSEFGVRSEVNVFIDAEGQVHVTGGEPQQRVLPILAGNSHERFR
jgi:Xaa-Pro aminopeptidase